MQTLTLLQCSPTGKIQDKASHKGTFRRYTFGYVTRGPGKGTGFHFHLTFHQAREVPHGGRLASRSGEPQSKRFHSSLLKLSSVLCKHISTEIRFGHAAVRKDGTVCSSRR